MGLEGDQILKHAQNRTLDESDQNDVSVHLFEVFKPRVYTYMGIVQLAGERFQETQLDINENARKVWVFPLKLADGHAPHPIGLAKIADRDGRH